MAGAALMAEAAAAYTAATRVAPASPVPAPVPQYKPRPPQDQHCAGCGAPINPSRTVCEYCRLPLVKTPPSTWEVHVPSVYTRAVINY